jgi:hypothetical protein
MKTLSKIFACAVICCLFSMSAFAQGPAWVKLGTRLVNFAADHDEVPVTGQEGTFSAIKIKVYGAAINMNRVVVHYRNGGHQEIELRNNFAPGSESRVIDLVGDERIITHIALFYDTKNAAKRKAKVEIWGKH